MDFSHSDEQQMLLETARRYLRDRYGFDQRRAILTGPDALSFAVWKDFAELGLLALNVAEADGGLGGGAVETLLVSMALGEGLVLEPFLPSGVEATRAIARLGSPAQRAEWLGPLGAGELVAVVVGLDEADRAVAIRATAVEGGVELHGRVPVVYHAPAAGLLLVAAASGSGSVADALYAVPADAVGVRRVACTTVDGQAAASVELDGVRCAASARIGGDATTELAALGDYAVVALCGEALGALDRSMALTVEYTKNRQQFGQPIARFQALQHRMVDMKARIEQARSLVYLAAACFDGPDAQQRAANVSAAKVLVCDAARYVGEQAVQLHGGMGVSDEMAISHYFKRLLSVRLRLGSEYAHLARYARQMTAAL